MSGLLVATRLFSKARIFFFGLLLIYTPAAAQSAAYKVLLEGLYDKDFPTVTADQIADLANYQILDTREKKEFEVSHLPNAIRVGYDSFDLSATDGLDKGKPVLVYCTVGARSQDIGRRLQAAGFTRVYNLYGGIIQWSNSGKTLEAGGMPTDKVHTYSKTWGIWLEQGEKVY
ncbi:rhodanese-like domain-containing protein [Algoriphagus terrigena]|uniref:rhodanese-like domain-containing protein n=1 Tax=Algoriphagus terrigena TaxID=344884 RepID=UPI000423253F|nr:rhodanese-like domain-containing protein [Algoriphagus terrigena]